MHSVINPAIYYWGTPVVLITTENEDGTTNIAPMSSAWWLGDRCVLGLASQSHTPMNLLRTKQCVLNLPSDDMGAYVNAIAKTTGSPVLSPKKQTLGYELCRDKFGRAGLTPQPSDLVRPPRIAECPVQMEVELVLRTHIQDDLRLPGHSNRVNADLWRPMIMSFQHLYGLAPKTVDSKLASIDEEKYRTLTGTALAEADPAELGREMDQSGK
ncbi:FMN-binding split barrel [Apiospora kogelbergensis]|uniref:FMN-binding split barrel n=1 Tax=Apiospora kogelbergensis TaxID=1337665 RepID=UPI003130CACB